MKRDLIIDRSAAQKALRMDKLRAELLELLKGEDYATTYHPHSHQGQDSRAQVCAAKIS